MSFVDVLNCNMLIAENLSLRRGFVRRDGSCLLYVFVEDSVVKMIWWLPSPLSGLDAIPSMLCPCLPPHMPPEFPTLPNASLR